MKATSIPGLWLGGIDNVLPCPVMEARNGGKEDEDSRQAGRGEDLFGGRTGIPDQILHSLADAVGRLGSF